MPLLNLGPASYPERTNTGFGIEHWAAVAQVVKNLLECHMYLKIYLIWGTEKVRDLKDQQELYSHLRWLEFNLILFQLSLERKKI